MSGTDPDAEKPWLAHYEPGVPHTVAVPEVAIPELLRESARRWPDRPAGTYYGRTPTSRALRAGAVVVPHSPLYVEREVQHQLADSGAEIAVALDLLLPRIQAVQ